MKKYSTQSHPLTLGKFKKTLLASALLSFSHASLSGSVLIEEVFITAQKTEQLVSDAGLSVTAFSGSQLKELGYTSSIEIAQQTPGLNIIQFHPSITNVSIRGISQNEFADHLEPPIAMYVDDAYVSAMGAGHAQMYDTERVEVLRGPQGTLFGRNATGGLIHYISVRPSEEFSGYASATVGNYGQKKVEGAISGSLSDNIQSRLSFAYNKNDGYLENRIGDDLRDTDAQAVRLQFAWQPSDTIDTLLKLHHAKDDSNGNGYTHFSTVTDPATGLAVAANAPDFTGYQDLDNNPWKGDYNEIGFFKREINGATTKISWDFSDESSFTSISDYLTMTKDYREDTDGGPNPYLSFNTLQDFSQFSQEFRVNYDGEMSRSQVGLYYLDIDTDAEAFWELDLVNFGIPGITEYGQLVEVGGNDSTIKSESIAIFAQGEYDFTDTLMGTLGARYTEDERELEYNGYDVGVGADAFVRIDDKINYENISYRAQLDWRPDSDTLVFSALSRTHKAGNWRLATGLPFAATEHDEEILTSFELGAKLTILDGGARLNATAFYYDYEDYQAFVVDATIITGAFDIVNVDAEAYGAEIELIANPISGLDLVLGASFIESTVEDVLYPDSVTRDSELPYSPAFSVNGLVRYQWNIGGGELAAQMDFNHSDNFCFSVFCGPTDEEDAYTVYNARVKYDFPGEQWSITAFVNNVTEEEYRVYSFDVSGLGFNDDTFANPRTYGVTVDVKF